MTAWLLIALGWSVLVTNFPQPRVMLHDSNQSPPQLMLESRIRDEKYLVDNNSPRWRWSLILTYKNVGTGPILLYKKSSLIYRSMISRNLKAALSGKYEQDISSHFISVDAMRAAGFLDRQPEESDFVVLRPGESYNVETEYGVAAVEMSGPKRAVGDERFIQLRVATWYFYAEPEEYRQKWRDKGLLWSQDITSQPMPFTLK